MENEAFAPKEQMLHFPLYFQIHGISKASKGTIDKLGVFHANQISMFLDPHLNIG